MSSGNSSYDILYVHPSWFGEFAKAGYLAPISKYLSDPKRNPPGFSAASYLPSVLSQGAYKGVQTQKTAVPYVPIRVPRERQQ